MRVGKDLMAHSRINIGMLISFYFRHMETILWILVPYLEYLSLVCSSFVHVRALPCYHSQAMPQLIPSWLQEALATAKSTARSASYLLDDDGHRWGTGGGVRRIVRTLLLGTRAASASTSKAVEPGSKADFDDID